jgi:hypothetical protein
MFRAMLDSGKFSMGVAVIDYCFVRMAVSVNMLNEDAHRLILERSEAGLVASQFI